MKNFNLAATNISVLDENGTVTIPIIVGQLVVDDLTNKPSEILEIVMDEKFNIGIKLDSDYLEGLRHPWEISLLK